MKTVRKVTKPDGGKSRRSRGKALVPAAKDTYRTRDLAAAGYFTRRLAR
jgi:hypothetical protein